MNKVSIPTGYIFFSFTDGDYEERFNMFSEMKNYAKNNYLREYHNDIHFAAFVYNSFCNCIEPYDSIKVNARTSKKAYSEFSERCTNEILKNISNN